MKKTFVTPAVDTVELSSGEIMFLSANIAEKKTNVDYTKPDFSDTEGNERFGYWGGKKDGWV